LEAEYCIENLPTALAHKEFEYFVTKMNNFHVYKESTPAIIQTNEMKKNGTNSQGLKL
jgi:hypothetical protein